MKSSTVVLMSIFLLGFGYSLAKLFTGTGGGGLGDFFDGLGYTSVVLFVSSLVIILFHIRRIRYHLELFVFLFMGLPLTMVYGGGLIWYLMDNRTPDLVPRYPRPVSRENFMLDSARIAVQIDSLVAMKNRDQGGPDVVSASIDTILYAQSGRQIFVIYIQKYEASSEGGDLSPAYLTASERDSIYWHLREGTPNADQLIGRFREVNDLKTSVRKYYFNQYAFPEKDSMQENYFWGRSSIK